MPAAAAPATWASPRPAGWPTTTPSGATPTTSPASSPTCARPTRTCIASWATSPNCWTTRPHASCWSPTSSARAEARQNGRPHDFLDKVAYGSDWHMPSMVDNTARYLDVFVDIMNPRLCRASRPVLPRHGDGVPEALKRAGPGASGTDGMPGASPPSAPRPPPACRLWRPARTGPPPRPAAGPIRNARAGNPPRPVHRRSAASRRRARVPRSVNTSFTSSSRRPGAVRLMIRSDRNTDCGWLDVYQLPISKSTAGAGRKPY